MNLFRVLCALALACPLAACRVAVPPKAAEEPPDHDCRNAEQWAEWSALLAKYPRDQDIISLYALRIGLCAMIERKQVDAGTAIGLFERAHQIVIGKTIDRAAAERRENEL